MKKTNSWKTSNLKLVARVYNVYSLLYFLLKYYVTFKKQVPVLVLPAITRSKVEETKSLQKEAITLVFLSGFYSGGK